MPNSSRTIADDLKRTFGDACILPDDARYDGARTGFFGGFDRRPAALVRARDAGQVARVVAFARDAGVELAVRSGGHSSAGHNSSDGGIVLDLREMSAIDIDAASRFAWAETGATTGAFTKAAAEHGLVVGFGDTGSVGIGGITLGGGIGFLVRKHGLTVDSLLAAEVVTADGRLVYTDAASAAGPVLGDPWRWRQLRRRHPAEIPPPRSAGLHRRHAVPSGDGGERRPVCRSRPGGA